MSLEQFARTAPLHQTLEYAGVDGLNLLSALLKRGDLQAAAVLLDRGFPPDENNWGLCSSAMTEMARIGACDALKLLLSRGARANGHEHEDLPPLHAALLRHQYDAAMILVEHGADVNGLDGSGKTSLDYASDARVIKRLVDAGAVRRPQR